MTSCACSQGFALNDFGSRVSYFRCSHRKGVTLFPRYFHAISTPFLWRGRGSEVRTFSDLFPKAPSPNFQAQFRTCVSRCYRVNTTGSSAAASTWTSSSLTTLVPTKCCSPAMVPDTKPHYAHGSPCCRRPFAKSCANHEELAVVLPSNAF